MNTTEPTAGLARDLARDLDRYFDTLILAFQQPLFGYSYRMTASRQDAEEIVQDVFVRAYRALKEYDGDRIRDIALSPWLYRICVNQIRNKRRRPAVLTQELVNDPMPIDGSVDPVADSYQQVEGNEEMQRLLATLPAAYRSAVVLRFVNDLSYPEIAATLQQPEGTVKSNVHRGLKLLREHLAGTNSPALSSSTPQQTTVFASGSVQ